MTDHLERVVLKATTAHQARKEISARWPKLDVNYEGYDIYGECVIMSLVRKQGDKAGVATVRKNRAGPAIQFIAKVPSTPIRDVHGQLSKEEIQAIMEHCGDRYRKACHEYAKAISGMGQREALDGNQEYWTAYNKMWDILCPQFNPMTRRGYPEL